MDARRRTMACALLLAVAAGGATAQDDRAKRQAEIRAAAQAALEKFYKAEPKLRAEVAKAPGYAVFTTYGLSFFVGGAGGKGLVHDAASRSDTFMNMGQASAGVQFGAGETDLLIVFRTRDRLRQFVDKGWDASGGGGGTGGAAGRSAGGTTSIALGNAMQYTITRNGFQAGAAVAGAKFWKDAELN